jgi:hypothetical protein
MRAVSWKISLVAAALVLAVGTPVQAQFARKYAGLTGGATYSNVSNYGAISTDYRWGGTAGIMAGVVTFDYSYVELAPSWSQMGADGVHLDYIDIPLILGGLVPLGNRETIGRLYAGVSLALKVTCKADVTTVCDAAKSSVWGLPVGISIARVISGGRFVGVDARYNIGLSDVFEVTDATQRSWQFRAMFGLPLGGR